MELSSVKAQRWIRQSDWLLIIYLTNKIIDSRLSYLQAFWLVQIGHVIPQFFSFLSRKTVISKFNFEFSKLFRCQAALKIFGYLLPQTDVSFWDPSLSHLTLTFWQKNKSFEPVGFLSLLMVRIFINFTFCNVAKFVCLWRKIFSRKWDKQDHPIRCLLVVFKIQLHQLI